PRFTEVCRFRPERVPLSRRVVPTPPGSILVAPNALHPCAEGVWGDKKGDTPMSQVVPSWPKKWYPRRPLPTEVTSPSRKVRKFFPVAVLLEILIGFAVGWLVAKFFPVLNGPIEFREGLRPRRP